MWQTLSMDQWLAMLPAFLFIGAMTTVAARVLFLNRAQRVLDTCRDDWLQAAAATEIGSAFDYYHPEVVPVLALAGLRSAHCGWQRRFYGQLEKQFGSTHLVVTNYQFELHRPKVTFTQTMVVLMLDDIRLPTFFARPRLPLFPWMSYYERVKTPAQIDCEYDVEGPLPYLVERLFDVDLDLTLSTLLRERQWIVEADGHTVILFQLNKVTPSDQLPSLIADSVQLAEILRQRYHASQPVGATASWSE